MKPFAEGIITIMLSVVGLAMVAIIISRKSNTAGVIQATASGLANNIGVAISPVTGATYSMHLDYPGSSSFGN